MKKIFMMSVCLVLALMMLVGCGERIIGEYLPNYDYQPTVIEELTFNLYIICGAETEENAKNTVEQRLTQYTEEKFKTKLNIFYIPDTEDYAARIKEVVAPDAENRADIILINSDKLASDLMTCEYVIIDKKVAAEYEKTADDLAAIVTDEAINAFKALGSDAKDAVKKVTGNEGDKAKYESEGYHVNVLKGNALADLTALYDTNAFGKLNVQITSSLLNASTIPTWVNVLNDKGEIVLDADGNNKVELVDKIYTVPNNRVLGHYEYVLIDKTVARKYYQSDADLAKLTNADAIAEFTAMGADAMAAVTYCDDGLYEDKAKYEAEGYYVNVLKYPTVTAEDAFASAFAVVDVIDTPNPDNNAEIAKENKRVRDLHTTRAMEIIYAFNTDETIHNTLLYGVKGTNYTIDDDGYVTRVTEGNSVYYINIFYAGDVFKSYYCEEFGWNADTFANGEKQNAQSVNPIVEVPEVPEVAE